MRRARRLGRPPGHPIRGGRFLLPLLIVFSPLAVTACIDENVRTVRHREVAAADPRRAELALRRYGCVECHTIPGVRGANGLVGPPLTRWAERRYIVGRLPNQPDYLIHFLVSPQAVKPGSAMPATGIGAAEARDVAAYLYTLR